MHKIFSLFLIGVMLSSVLVSVSMSNVTQVFAENPSKNNPCDALEKAETQGNGKHLGISKALENNECDPVKLLVKEYNNILSILGEYDDFTDPLTLQQAQSDLNELYGIVNQLQELGVIITIHVEYDESVIGTVFFFNPESLDLFQVIIPEETLAVLATLGVIEEVSLLDKVFSNSDYDELLSAMRQSVPNIVLIDDDHAKSFVVSSTCIGLADAITCAIPELFEDSGIEIAVISSISDVLGTSDFNLVAIAHELENDDYLSSLIRLLTNKHVTDTFEDVVKDIIEAEIMKAITHIISVDGLKFHDFNFNFDPDVGDSALPDWKFALSQVVYGKESPLLSCSPSPCLPTDNTQSLDDGMYRFEDVQINALVEKIIVTEMPTAQQLAQGWVHTTPPRHELEIDFDNLPENNKFDENNFGNRQEASVIVITQVVNNDEGTLDPSDFTQHVSAMTNALPSTFPGADAGVVVKLTPGAYEITQDPVAGYTTEFDGCSADETDPIVGGEFQTCRITNTFESTTPVLGNWYWQMYDEHSGARCSNYTFSEDEDNFVVTSPASSNRCNFYIFKTFDADSIQGKSLLIDKTSTNNFVTSGGSARTNAWVLDGSYRHDNAGIFINENCAPAGELNVFGDRCLHLDENGSGVLLGGPLLSGSNIPVGNGPSVIIPEMNFSSTSPDGKVTIFFVWTEIDCCIGGKVNTFSLNSIEIGDLAKWNFGTTAHSSHIEETESFDCTRSCGTITGHAEAHIELTVITETINDDEGTQNSSEFIARVTGIGVVPSEFAGVDGDGIEVRLAAGGYQVTQDQPAGYDTTFTNDCSGSVIPGDEKTCIITNDDRTPPTPVLGNWYWQMYDEHSGARCSNYTFSEDEDNFVVTSPASSNRCNFYIFKTFDADSIQGKSLLIDKTSTNNFVTSGGSARTNAWVLDGSYRHDNAGIFINENCAPAGELNVFGDRCLHLDENGSGVLLGGPLLSGSNIPVGNGPSVILDTDFSSTSPDGKVTIFFVWTEIDCCIGGKVNTFSLNSIEIGDLAKWNFGTTAHSSHIEETESFDCTRSCGTINASLSASEI